MALASLALASFFVCSLPPSVVAAGAVALPPPLPPPSEAAPRRGSVLLPSPFPSAFELLLPPPPPCRRPRSRRDGPLLAVRFDAVEGVFLLASLEALPWPDFAELVARLLTNAAFVGIVRGLAGALACWLMSLLPAACVFSCGQAPA